MELQECIGAWAKKKKKKKQSATLKKGADNLTKSFANDTMYRAETLRLFARWSSLTSDAVRTKQMEKLFDMSYGRWGGYRKVNKSIGNAEKEKDKNLRDDVRKLLEKWYPTEDLDADSAAHDDEEEEAETGEYEHEDEGEVVPVEIAKDTPDHNSLDGEVDFQDARMRIIRKISENWDSALTGFAPGNAVLITVKNSPIRWPFETLKPLLKLSKITKSERKEREVRRVLQKGFPPRARYDLSKSLKTYGSVYSYFEEKEKDMANTDSAPTSTGTNSSK